MSTWIAVDENFLTHSKTLKLKKLIGAKTKREAGSYVIALWLFTMKNAWRDGDLTAYGPDGIEDACEWLGTPGELYKALQDCGRAQEDGKPGSGYLTGNIVNDWQEWASRLIKGRLYREERRKQERGDTPPALSANALAIWNAFAEQHGLAAVQKPFTLPAGLDEARFASLVDKAGQQPFLLGGGKDAWKMDLHWLLRPANMAKVEAGAYFEGKAPAEVPANGDVGGYRERTKAILAQRNKQKAERA